MNTDYDKTDIDDLLAVARQVPDDAHDRGADPQSFKDTAGREWTLRLTVGRVRRIRAALNFDFLKIDERAIQRLVVDDEFVVDVLWLLLEEQALGRDLSREDFEDAVDRDVLDKSREALAETLVNFSPPAVRPAMRALMGEVDKSTQEAAELAVAKINGPKGAAARKRLLQQVGEQMDRQLEKAGGPSSPNSAASPASTRNY